MNLLIVSPIYIPEIGGPTTYISELKKHLPSKINLSILAFSKKSVKRKGVVLVSTQTNSLLRQLNFAIEFLQLIQKADIVYIMEPLVVGFVTSLICFVLRKKVVLKFVGDPCWEEYRRMNNSSEDLYQFYTLKKNLRSWRFWFTFFVLWSNSKIITPSVHLKNFLKKYYRVPEYKIEVIYNSVAIHSVPVKETNSLIFCGRLVAWKNIDLLLKSFSVVRNEKAFLKIVGDGPERQKLVNLVMKLKLSRKVYFLGQLDQTSAAKEVGKSQILIILSDYEGLSHVVLEALSQGTVVIASNIPGNDEIIEDKFNGYLVDRYNSLMLSNRILELITDKKLYRTMSLNSLKVARAKFNWKINISKLMKIFDEIPAR